MFVDQETHDRMLTGIPKLGRHIGISTIIDKYKVIGSVARMMIRKLIANGSLRFLEKHSKQYICTPTASAVEKVVEKDAGKKEKGKKKN